MLLGVLIGGKSSRLFSHVGCSKILARIGSDSVLSLVLRPWIRLGVTRLVFSVNHYSNEIIDKFGDYFEGIKISYVFDGEASGTGVGVVKICEEAGQEEVVIINGDTFFFPAKSIREETEYDLAVVGCNKPRDLRYGLLDYDIKTNTLLSMKRPCLDSKSGQIELINSGVWKFSNTAVRYVVRLGKKEINKCQLWSFEDDLVPQILTSGLDVKVLVEDRESPFLDIGVPEMFDRAESWLFENEYGSSL